MGQSRARDHRDHGVSQPVRFSPPRPTVIRLSSRDVLPFAIQTLKDSGYNFVSSIRPEPCAAWAFLRRIQVTVSDCLGVPAYQSPESPAKRDVYTYTTLVLLNTDVSSAELLEMLTAPSSSSGQSDSLSDIVEPTDIHTSGSLPPLPSFPTLLCKL